MPLPVCVWPPAGSAASGLYCAFGRPFGCGCSRMNSGVAPKVTVCRLSDVHSTVSPA